MRNGGSGDKNSVRRYNAAADRIAKDVTAIEEQYPDRINDFFRLIYHPDTEVAHALAWYVYDRKSFSVRQKREAIRVIQHLLDSGAIKGVAAVHTQFCFGIIHRPKRKRSCGTGGSTAISGAAPAAALPAPGKIKNCRK